MSKNKRSRLKSFFNPRSVAVIGASATKGKVGNDIILNLKANFSGKIYPVNLRKKEIEGLTALSSVSKVEGNLDLAVIVIPAKFVASAVNECGRKKCKNIIIISAGFGEVGEDGKKMENDLLKLSKKYKLNILGPNCLGCISTLLPINVSFAATFPPRGNIAFFSQSGALGTAVLDVIEAQKVGLAYFVSMGNKIDIDEIDLLEYFALDNKVKVILGYLENIKNGRKFMDLATEITKKKPIIILKSGKTEAGQKAVSSHTGSFAGSAQAYSTAFSQSGVLEVDELQDFFNLAKGLAQQSLPQGNRVAVITNAGGPGILVTDLLPDHGLVLARLNKNTISTLKSKLPEAASAHNPIDVLGDAKSDRYGLALDNIIKDKNVDAVIVVLTPQKMTELEKTTKEIGRIGKKSKKPIILCFMGEASITPYYQIYQKNSLPQYNSPLQAVKVLGQMRRYAKHKQEKPKKNSQKDLRTYYSKKSIKDILKKRDLTEIDARDLLLPLGFPLHRAELVKNESELVVVAKKIKYPLALKIVSPQIIHKSDVGGVIVSIKNEKELLKGFESMRTKIKNRSPKVRIDGYLLGEMVKGLEVIIGMKRDAQFGPLVMVGAGGIYTEVFRDVSFRIAPFNKMTALNMISELKIYPLMSGSRGKKALDIDALADVLVRVSDFSLSFKEISEIDFNPVMVGEKNKGCTIVDVRFLK